MSRTLRKQTGDRWWLSKWHITLHNDDWRIAEKYSYKIWIEKDGVTFYSLSQHCKKHSNSLSRSMKKQQLHKVIKQADYEDVDFIHTRSEIKGCRAMFD